MSADFRSQVVARVAHEQTANRVPSLGVAVGVGGVPWVEASAGFADIENRVPATPTSCYRIGSITKTFVAVLILTLWRQGELSLDAPIDQYLPGTPFGQVSPRMLLCHNAGLPREVPVDMWESMQGPTAGELLEAFDRVELVAEPGQRWHYSNLGYAVLGQIVERVMTRPCDIAIEQCLLRPLELVDARWSAPADAVVGCRLDPYAEAVYREVQPVPLLLPWQPAPPCPVDVRDLLGSWWSESDEIVFRWRSDGLHAHLASDPATTDTHFTHEAPGSYRATRGRLEGELLTVSRAAAGLSVHWATYPLARTPR